MNSTEPTEGTRCCPACESGQGSHACGLDRGYTEADVRLVSAALTSLVDISGCPDTVAQVALAALASAGRIQSLPPASAEEPDHLDPDEMLLYRLYRHLDCGTPVDRTDPEDCANVAAESIRVLRAAGRLSSDVGEARAGYDQAIAVLRGVYQRTGSPAARWAADYLAADPDREAPATNATAT